MLLLPANIGALLSPFAPLLTTMLPLTPVNQPERARISDTN